MKFDLRYFREIILKSTQTELARQLGIRQDAVSRMEKAPDEITINMLMNIAEKTGYSIEDLLSLQHQQVETLFVEDNWTSLLKKRNQIMDYIDGLTSSIIEQSYNQEALNKLNAFKNNLKKIIKKPRVAFLGNSDVGKSTLINSLIGQEVLPTAWTPTTSIPIIIRHIDEKPLFVKDSVVTFKQTDGLTNQIDYSRLDDHDYYKKWFYESGTVDILTKYGTRQGEGDVSQLVGSSILYVESKLLETCELMDLPGFGTGDRVEDDEMALEGKKTADIFVYLSISNGFMRGTDIDYLKETLTALPLVENKNTNNLKPLNNLYVIASQAQIIDNQEKIETILDKGSSRVIQTLPNKYWVQRTEQSGHDYDETTFRNRFFSYSKDSNELRENFEKDFRNLLENLPLILEKKSADMISEISDGISNELEVEIQKVEKLQLKRDEIKEELEQFKTERANVVKVIAKEKTKVISNFRELRGSSLTKLSTKLSNVLNVDKIVSLIENKNFKNKKSDKELLYSLIASTVEQEFKDITEEESIQIKRVTEKFINSLEKSTKNIKSDNFKRNTSINLNTDFIGFDFKKAFVSGIAAAATYGGLTLYMSTLGNLGGYILVTKAVSVLSAVGIGVGGTATAVAAVSSIGGPVTLVIGLTIASFLVAYSISGIGWEKSLAKQIIKGYKKENVQNKYEEALNTFWNETEETFNLGVDNIIESYDENIKINESYLLINNEEYKSILQDLSNLKKYVIHMSKEFTKNI